MSSSNKTLVGNHNSSSRGMLAIIWLLVLYGVSLLVFFAEFREEDSFAYFVTVLVGIGFAPVIGYQYLRGGRWKDKILMHPPLQISAWIIVMFVVPGIVGFYDRTILEEFKNIWRTQLVIMNVDHVKGISIVSQGFLLMWIGYIIGLSFIERHNNRDEMLGKTSTLNSISHTFSQQVVMIFYLTLISIAIIDVSIRGVSFGSDNSLYGYFSFFIGTVSALSRARLIFLMILIYNLRKGKGKSVTILFLCIEVLYAFVEGYTKPLLWIIIMCGFTLYLSGVKFRQYTILAIISSILLGVFMVPISQKLRVYIGSETIDSRSVKDLITSLFDAYDDTWGEGFDIGWDIFAKKMVDRQVIVSYMPGVVFSKTPSVMPYEGFSRFFEIPRYLIPTFIWQDKPDYSRGVWFSHFYVGIDFTLFISSALTVYGENYMYAGIFGVAFGQFLFGFILSLIFVRFRYYGFGVLLVLLIPIYIDIESQYSTMVPNLLRFAILYSIVHALALTLSNSGNKSRRLLPKHYSTGQRVSGIINGDI